jgi:hypothetical protein
MNTDKIHGVHPLCLNADRQGDANAPLFVVMNFLIFYPCSSVFIRGPSFVPALQSRDGETRRWEIAALRSP